MKYMEIRKLDRNLASINYEVLRLLPKENDPIVYISPIFYCQLWRKKYTGFETADEELLELKNRSDESIKNDIVKLNGYFCIKVDL